MAVLLATGLKALFFTLSCTFGAIDVYNYYNYPVYRIDTYSTWLCAYMFGYFIHTFTLVLWAVYKESNFVHQAIWAFFMWWLGSFASCGYIFIQLLKLSPQESAQDPIYHVLLRPEHKRCEEENGDRKPSSSVVAARITFISLGCLMIALAIYAPLTAGSPLRREVGDANIVDSAFLTVALLVWIAYKETSWLIVSMWSVLFICFGSLTTCAYVTKQLFQLSPESPAYLILLKHNKDVRLPLLISSAKSGGQG